VHLPVSAPPFLHLPALRVPGLSLTARPPVAAVLLSVLYAAAIVVALTAPGQHAVAGCAVLAGLVGRGVARRRRSTAGALAAATVAVDSIAPTPVLAEEPVAA
jgi:hypothetical protein